MMSLVVVINSVVDVAEVAEDVVDRKDEFGGGDLVVDVVDVI